MLGEPRIHVEECESTQLLLDPSLPEGAVATTRHQTGGRGRLGRTWLDEPGASLLVSVLLKPPRGRNPAELTLVAGLAVAEAVEAALGRRAEIKWPNDVLLDGRKVSGGLAELRDAAVVLGIGVNVNQVPDVPTEATSLRATDGVERDLEPLLIDLLLRIGDAYDTWRDAGLAALHPRIEERDALRGKTVTVGTTTGTVVGIRPDGRLELDNGVVESGEVLFVQHA